jgi:hypothetical protein
MFYISLQILFRTFNILINIWRDACTKGHVSSRKIAVSHIKCKRKFDNFFVKFSSITFKKNAPSNSMPTEGPTETKKLIGS